MKNAILVSIVGICMSSAGCDTPSSQVVGDEPSESVVTVETEDTPVAEEEKVPEVVASEPEEDSCAVTPDSSDAPPFGYDADWCFSTEHGMQCEWYVGPNGTMGCYESYTFYDNECGWFFQYDYCG